MARPPKGTPAVKLKILAFLRAGCTKSNAALAAGMKSYNTFTAACAADKKFAADVVEAEEGGIAWHVLNVMNGAKKDPRLSIEVLKRRRPDEWGDRTEYREADLTTKTDAELLAIRDGKGRR